MPFPHSPHRVSSPDLAGDMNTIGYSQNDHSLPFRPQSPSQFASPRPSVEVSPMATTIHTSTATGDHGDSSMGFTIHEQEQMRWAAASNFPVPQMGYTGIYSSNRTPCSAPYGEFYHQAQNDMSYNHNYDLAYSARLDPGCPRSYTGMEFNGLPKDVSTSESYPPAVYQIEPQQQHDAMDLSDPEIKGQLMEMCNDYDQPQYGAPIKVEDLTGYQSPYSDLTRASTPHDGSTSEEVQIDKEQPYAQLIYQALMGRPDKTMILRDIYDWFKEHTDKAAGSETKGWQNSIRHNLSMNGAFEKVDQPCEDSRKGFMWRLTEEAIREGVKSTTRYRSKQPNKRGHRVQHPLPQRQASGAKGGQAAHRSAKVRRSHRMQDAYQSRSVPAAFDPMYNDTDTSLPYPPSPYYASEADFGYSIKPENRGGPLAGHHSGIFSPPTPYMRNPMPHGLPMTDTAFMIDQSSNGSLYTDTPSPPDEAPTPVDQGGWNDEIGLRGPFVYDELAYNEYAG